MHCRLVLCKRSTAYRQRQQQNQIRKITLQRHAFCHLCDTLPLQARPL
jgi:hypothetical protein